jgi:hypothetical protein
VEAKITVSPRLDQLDAERFREMLASPPFQLLMARLHAELERARTTCERDNETRDLHRAQGAAGALRSALALPAMILAEIEAGARK